VNILENAQSFACGPQVGHSCSRWNTLRNTAADFTGTA